MAGDLVEVGADRWGGSEEGEAAAAWVLVVLLPDGAARGSDLGVEGRKAVGVGRGAVERSAFKHRASGRTRTTTVEGSQVAVAGSLVSLSSPCGL